MKSNKYLTSMLPEAMILFEANKSLAKKITDLGNEKSTEGIVKLWHFAGALEGHTYVQSCARVQERLKMPQTFSSGWTEPLHNQ